MLLHFAGYVLGDEGLVAGQVGGVEAEEIDEVPFGAGGERLLRGGGEG